MSRLQIQNVTTFSTISIQDYYASLLHVYLETPIICKWIQISTNIPVTVVYYNKYFDQLQCTFLYYELYHDFSDLKLFEPWDSFYHPVA